MTLSGSGNSVGVAAVEDDAPISAEKSIQLVGTNCS
jgi:hypothetical protein